MKNIYQTIIRFGLGILFLVLLVYPETGLWTCVWLGIGYLAYELKIIVEQIKNLNL